MMNRMIYDRIALDAVSTVRPTNVDALITVTTSPATSAQETINTFDKLTNCPNCGAPITSSKCEYCGTVFRDFDREIYMLKQDIVNLGSRMRAEDIYAAAIKAMMSYSGGI